MKFDFYISTFQNNESTIFSNCEESKLPIKISSFSSIKPQENHSFGQKNINGYLVVVYEIRNDFFGEKITVSGLITGGDLKNQLSDKNLGSQLLLPVNMFRSGEEVFLDDVTVGELSQTLQVPVTVVKSSGQDLLDALLDKSEK